MNEKTIIMKNEIHTISKYRALLFSKYYFTLALSIITLYLSTMRLTVSSLYILIILYALPTILAFVFKDYVKKHSGRIIKDLIQDRSFHLSILKRKYKYTRLNYVTNSLSFLVMTLLITLWQINYSLIENHNIWLSKVPFLTLITGLTLRFLSVYYYRIKLHYDLINNKL